MQRRDLQFDSLLKHGLDARRESGAGECPNESTLAAYCERSLSRAEAGRCEEHLSNCARCRATVGAIVRAGAGPVGTHRGSRRWELYAAIAAAVVGISVAAGLIRRSEIPVRVLQSASPKSAALRPRAPEAGPQIAFNEASKRQAPEIAQPGVAQAPPAPNPRQIAAAQKKFEKLGLTGRGEAEGRAKTAGVPAAPQGPAYFGAGNAALPAPAAPPPQAQTPQAPPAVPMADAGARTAASGTWLGGLAGARASMVSVRTADNVERWRLGADGTIEHREPDGAWQRQNSGVSYALRSGDAPSPVLCWVVGSGGTILRTTDGQHWHQIKSPTSADLIAVHAVDASAATVTAADGKRYSTADGGHTWNPT